MKKLSGPEDEDDELIDWDETAEREAEEIQEWVDEHDVDYDDDYD